MSCYMTSVVIPSYNCANYLPQAVASVADQTYQKIELIIVDDASTDNSIHVIESIETEYRSRFSGIKITKNSKNTGAHAAINTGVQSAEGEYISILNADDMYRPERLTVMTECMGSSQLAFSRVECIDADGEQLKNEQTRKFENAQQKITGKPFAALGLVAENAAISSGNMLFTKQLFLKTGGFRNYKYVHDYDFFFRACLITEPFFTNDTAYLYRLHGSNSFTRLAKEGLRENRMVWLDEYSRIQRGKPENPEIAKHSDYIQMFEQAVAAEGAKKNTLWRMAANPLVRAGMSAMKKFWKV